jgi:hypothetical protein
MRAFQKPAKHGEPWSPEEDARLREMAANSSSALAIAKDLGRSLGSVQGRATVLNVKISYRTPKIRD